MSEPRGLEERVSVVENGISHINDALKELKAIVLESQKPKPFNWVGLGSLIVSSLVAIGTFVWLFLNLRLSPIESRFSAMEVAFQEQASRVNRELTWNYDNQRLYHEFTIKNVDRLWERVFNVDAPSFNAKPKP